MFCGNACHLFGDELNFGIIILTVVPTRKWLFNVKVNDVMHKERERRVFISQLGCFAELKRSGIRKYPHIIDLRCIELIFYWSELVYVSTLHTRELPSHGFVGDLKIS